MRIDVTIRSHKEHHLISRGLSRHTSLISHLIQQKLLHDDTFISCTAISIGYLPYQREHPPVIQP